MRKSQPLHVARTRSVSRSPVCLAWQELYGDLSLVTYRASEPRAATRRANRGVEPAVSAHGEHARHTHPPPNPNPNHTTHNQGTGGRANNDRGARERRDNPDTLHTCAHDSSRKRNAQTQLGPVVAVDLVPKRGMRARLSHAAYPNREAPSARRTPLPISGHVTHPHHPFSLATSVSNVACTRAAPRASRSRHACA